MHKCITTIYNDTEIRCTTKIQRHKITCYENIEEEKHLIDCFLAHLSQLQY